MVDNLGDLLVGAFPFFDFFDFFFGGLEVGILEDEEIAEVSGLISLGDRRDDHKFSVATPRRGAHACLRALEGCPSGKRLKRDIQFFEHASWEIHRHRGAVVPGPGDRKGRRHQLAAVAMDVDGTKVDSRGGPRQRDIQKQIDDHNSQWWHPDAMAELGVKVEKSLLSAMEMEAWNVDDDE